MKSRRPVNSDVGWLTFKMDTICLPVRYDRLTESDVQVHLRHIASNLEPRHPVEFLFPEANIVIPMVKHIYKRRVATIDVLLRSGSISRDELEKIRELLQVKSYDLKIYRTSKRKMLRRVIVRLPIDGTIAITGSNILKELNTMLGFDWPTPIAIGYAVGTRAPGLPGKLSFRQPFRNVGYHVGYAVGRAVRRVISE